MSGGYTQSQLDDVQAKWSLRFPPDLLALLRKCRRVIDHGQFGSLDWLDASDQQIEEVLNWPFKGFSFDVARGLWWPEWGQMPSQEASRKERLKEIFAKAPKLIPVCGHRYIPEAPQEADNPIFSVWQMDVVYYGANLSDYIERETNPASASLEGPTPAKRIDFWSRAVEFNNERFATGGGFAFYNRGNVLPE